MIKNKTILTVSMVVMIAAVVWAVVATVVCVKQERKIQAWKEQCTFYKDQYHNCLNAKKRLIHKPRNVEQSISYSPGVVKIDSTDRSVNGTWVFIPNRGVFITSHNSLTVVP